MIVSFMFQQLAMNFYRTSMYKCVYHSLTIRKFYVDELPKKLSSTKQRNIPLSTQEGFSKEEFQEFKALQTKVVSDITNIEPYKKLPFLTSRIESMLNYNLSGGSCSSALVTIYIYKMISKPEERTPENIRQAILLGWCVRFFEALSIIMDDYIDNALMRYQKPSWHSLPHVGRNAALDAMLTASCLPILLQKYFSNHPQYTKISDAFQDAAFHANYCQFLDSIPFYEGNLTQEFLDVCYIGKSVRTSFRFVAAIAMHLANNENPEIYDKMENVMKIFGRWLQMQNDYLDVFCKTQDRPIGTDIKLAKITWLSVNAYLKCNTSQKNLFREHYGNASKDSVNQIINLYKQLEMQKLYEEHETKLCNEILEEIKHIPNDIVSHNLFHRLLNSMKQELCAL